MIVISKKRVQIIIASILISIIAFSIQLKNAVTTTATPISGKTIIIDAGHGTPDEED